jgi:hypothetical protein
MPLQKRPVHSLDDINQRRRDREVLNQVLDHSFDDSRRQTDAEKIAGVTPINPAFPPYNALRYGADPTGVEDSTSAIQNAINAALKDYHHTVTLPHGIIRIEGTIDVPEGVMIVGQGSQGTNELYGTVIIHYSNANLFVWDGVGTAFAGTGGGFKNATILKGTGFSGGYALHIYATDDDHRPGEMMLENIVCYGTGTGLWARGLNIDGTNCVTPGAAGIRSIVGDKLRFADCTDSNRYVSIENGVHITLKHLQIDQGNGTGTVGGTIGSGSDNINLIGCVINGELDINDTATNVNLQGRISNLDQNNASCSGTFIGTCPGGIRNNSKTFRISCPQADAFFAYITANVSNVTGNGTVYTIINTTEDHDRAGTHDTSTGVATCFCAGDHEFIGAVTVDGLTASHTQGILRFLHQTSGGSTVHGIDIHHGNVGAMRDAGDNLTFKGSVRVAMSEGDTMKMQLIVSNGGADDVDIVGSAGTRYTWLSGRLLA